MQRKRCSKCKITKVISNFGLDKGRGGTRRYCKECESAYKRKQYAENPYRREYAKNQSIKWKKKNPKTHARSERKSMLKRVYGLAIEEFDRKSTNQNGLCKICGLSSVNSQRKKISLSVDHNHNTNKIRGLLCQNCNLALGHLKVDKFGVQNLQMAIKYILETENGK